MHISILGLKQALWQGQAREVVLPTDDGEICVLDFHQPFLVSLTKGDIRFDAKEENGILKKRITIKDGIAHMHGNELAVLVET